MKLSKLKELLNKFSFKTSNESQSTKKRGNMTISFSSSSSLTQKSKSSYLTLCITTRSIHCPMVGISYRSGHFKVKLSRSSVLYAKSQSTSSSNSFIWKNVNGCFLLRIKSMFKDGTKVHKYFYRVDKMLF